MTIAVNKICLQKRFQSLWLWNIFWVLMVNPGTGLDKGAEKWMKKYLYRLLLTVSVAVFAAGCGQKEMDAKEEGSTQQKEMDAQEEESAQQKEMDAKEEGSTQQEDTATEKKEGFFSAGESKDVPAIITEYAEKEESRELAAFLASYYEIPEEYQTETRYYYNRIDLNEDGRDEIFTIVVGEYTKGDAGDPALLLAEGNGTFIVLESFEQIRTPVIICDTMTNGWHDIVLDVYGKGVDNGYLICRYNVDGGYQTAINEFTTELEPVSGTQILSNNLIDDMDKGNYFTLSK